MISAIKYRFSRTEVRWMPTLNGEVIKPGGLSGLPFSGFSTRREAIAAGSAVEGRLTIDDVLKCHAEHGELDWHLVKNAMGPNWPAKWEAMEPGEGIFARGEVREDGDAP